jgi:hypothetical protein
MKKIFYFLKHPLYIILSLGFRGFFRWVPDALWLKIVFRIKFGHSLNLKNPKTFNEKLQWLKLHDRNLLYTKLVDKYEVRQYITETIGEEYLIPLLGVWDKFDDIDFDKLPDQFVLKCSHDSGGLIICRDKSKLNIKAVKKKINDCLRRNYFWALREWPYKNVKPRIIAEKYMVDESETELKDYKVFCFNGEPKALFVATDRGVHQTKFDFFDTEFNHLPFKQHYPNNLEREIIKPKGLEKMLVLAEKLTKDFKHCRADFYDINGHVYFGELTFTHFSGFEPFEPQEWDYKFGDWINL